MSERLEVLIERLLEAALRGETPELDTTLADQPDLGPSDLGTLRALAIDLSVTPPDTDRTGEPIRALAEEASRTAFGPFELERELGRGGQAVVWLARDTRLGRRVALKILERGDFPIDSRDGRPGAAARLRREAEVASRLDHPAICAIYEMGVLEGVSYIAMRYVEGETLAQELAAARKERACHDARRRIGRGVVLIERMARAVHAAHELHIIHRDIKPGNVMITASGEPVILDFGLARDASMDESTLTRTGGLLGSPAYMAPEQIDERLGGVDARADVWALGVMLYECVTLHRPFEAPTREGLFRAILGDPLASPRARERALTRDLETVIETALERDPNRRYQTALDLAEDLRRVRDHESIRARPAGPLLRTRRWARRNPALASLIALVFLALSAALAVSRHVAAREREHVARLEADSLLNAASTMVRRDPSMALRMAVAASDHADLAPRRINETLLAALENIREVSRFQAHERSPPLAASDPGRRFLATAAGGEVRVWDWSSTERLASLTHSGPVQDLDVSPDGRYLTIGGSGRLVVWDTADWRRIADIEVADVHHVRFSPRGDRLLLLRAGAISLFEVDFDRLRPVALGDSGELHGASLYASWSSDGEHLLVSIDQSAILFDLTAGTSCEIPALRPPGVTVHYALDRSRAALPHAEGAYLFDSRDRRETLLSRGGGDPRGAPAVLTEFAPDGLRVLIGHLDGAVTVADASSGEVLCRINEFSAPLAAASFDSSGESVLLRSSQDGAVAVCSARTGTTMSRVAMLTPAVAAFWDETRGEPAVVTVDERGVVRRWRLESETVRCTIQGLGHPGVMVEFDASGRRIVLGSADRTLVYEVQTRRLLGELQLAPRSVEFDPSSNRLLTASRFEGAQLWDATTFKLIRTVCRHPEDTSSASFSRDGQRIVVACCDDLAHVLDIASDSAPLDFRGHSGDLRSAFFSDDGDYVVTSSEHLDDEIDDRSVRVWDSWGGKELRRLALASHGERPVIARFSPDGRRVAVGTWSGAIALWEWRTGELSWLRGNTGPACDARFSPDGGYVLSGSMDRVLRLWSSDTEELIAEYRGHRLTAVAHAFSPDGRQFASQSSDGTLRFWPVDPLARCREILSDLGAPIDQELEQISQLLGTP